MSRRVLGGGRVLGSSRNVLAATAPSPSPLSSATSADQVAKAPTPLPLSSAHNLHSPSASTISINSSTNVSSTPLPSQPADEDIVSNLSLAGPENGSSLSTSTSMPFAAPTSSAFDQLACPICNEAMVTLLQLNRHLDDIHKEIEEETQDEVKDWFKAQLGKAKKFQPLAVLNQKLKGLDVFESNGDPGGKNGGTSTPVPRGSVGDINVISGGSAGSGTQAATLASTSTVISTPSNSTAPKPAPPPDPDEVVRKDHWQKRTGQDACSDPMCGRRLGNTWGNVNCRHCGKLFCDEHTMYQMKLSRSAQHEPVRGIWCRVCETCYKSRQGYSERAGAENNYTSDFERLRRQRLDKTYLEVSRLEKRLTRLTQLLANPPEDIQPSITKRWSLTSWGQNDPKKALEQAVVTWQDDASVLRCPYCQQDFTQYTFRRHHCRTCGKVVCGDPATGCSVMLGLNVAPTNLQHPAEKPIAQASIPLDIRLCKECNTTLFARRDFAATISQTPPYVRAYNNLIQFERGIRLLLPKFQKLLIALQSPDKPPTSMQIADASRTRKRLIDSFTQYDVAARRIRDMPTESPTQSKLQKAIYQQASQFLHLHMLPLKSLPKILKHATPHGNARPGLSNGGTSSPLANGSGGGRPANALAAIHYASRSSFDSSSQISLPTSSASSAVSALEAEEKSLRERLIVLEEQKFMVSEMIADANRRRKFDEVAALAGNVEDLSREIDSVQNLISGLDFEGVYGAIGASGGGGVGAGLGSGVASPDPIPKAKAGIFG